MRDTSFVAIKNLLDAKAKEYNTTAFIDSDPISIPKQFTAQQDIEIMAFWTAMLSWGRRSTIIQNGQRLIDLFDGQPYHFILNHKPKDRQAFSEFKHRTFQFDDTLYFLDYFHRYYNEHEFLESAFSSHLSEQSENIETALIGFQQQFFSAEYAPKRTRKHVASPERKSTCKRLNMFLRWMVRKDDTGVDFGLWKSIHPRQLLIPYDVHVERVARSLSLVTRKQRDWKAVLELTHKLKEFDPEDPIRYDYALFGLGVFDQFE